MQYETVVTRYGSMRIPSADAVLGPSLRLYGEWAQDEIKGLSRLLKDGDIVIDAGANIGTHTLAFAAAIAPSGRVYSFEPQTDIYELLKSNCDTNARASNITTYCHPLSSISGKAYRVPIYDDASIHNFGATQLTEIVSDSNSELTTSIASKSIDELQLEACRLIKLDVEGMELEVLNGAVHLIGKCNPLIFFEANTISEAWQIIQQFISSGGYSARVVISDAFSHNNYNKNDLNIFSDYQETSILLYMKAEEAAVISAFPTSIQIISYSHLAISLALICHRPPEHPLKKFPLNDETIYKHYKQNVSLLSDAMLSELIYQHEKNAARENFEATSSSSRTALMNRNEALTQENTNLINQIQSYEENYKVLTEKLHRYEMFPLIRLIRKLKSIAGRVINFGKFNS
jgi:FkbM family methyltransferase